MTDVRFIILAYKRSQSVDRSLPRERPHMRHRYWRKCFIEKTLERYAKYDPRFMVAGHETIGADTTDGASWRAPTDSDGHPELNALPYLDMVVKASLCFFSHVYVD